MGSEKTAENLINLLGVSISIRCLSKVKKVKKSLDSNVFPLVLPSYTTTTINHQLWWVLIMSGVRGILVKSHLITFASQSLLKGSNNAKPRLGTVHINHLNVRVFVCVSVTKNMRITPHRQAVPAGWKATHRLVWGERGLLSHSSRSKYSCSPSSEE